MVLLLEGLHMLDVVDEVLDLLQHGQGLCGNYVAQVLLNLHCYFDLVERVESVVDQLAL
jgi:hypothetical protein